MKLLHRTTRDFLLATVVILVVTGIGLYLFLHKEVSDEMDEQLAFQAELISQHIAKGELAGYPFASITPTSDPVTTPVILGDTLIYDVVQKIEEGYHYMDQVKTIGGQNYHIKVMMSYIGWDEYYKTIFYIILMAIILLAASGVLITYFSNRNLWRPFFLNLKNLREYSVSDPEPLQLHESPIAEFKELKAALKDLTDRGRREYLALREFTENASHEIQTPLGIIQSKLDRLSQLAVTEEMANYIVQAKSGVERLSKMNKNLLLLAKLDNNAFDQRQSVLWGPLVKQHLDIMADLFTSKELVLCPVIGAAEVTADPYLCETLLSNLLTNALRHTDKGGKVNINLSSHSLSVSNTAPPLPFPRELLFNRFQKDNKNSHYTGLGLAIVKQICLFYNWELKYRYEEGMHWFVVQF